MDVDPDALDLDLPDPQQILDDAVRERHGKRGGKRQGMLKPKKLHHKKVEAAPVNKTVVAAAATSRYEMPSTFYSCTAFPNQRRTGGGLVGGDVIEQVAPFIVTLNSVQECLKACEDEPTCQQYVFVVPSSLCYRMNVLNPDNGEFMDGYVSGSCHQDPKQGNTAVPKYDPAHNFNGAMVDPSLPHNEEAEEIMKAQIQSMWKPWSPEDN
jgi:hypothetical protein